MIDPSDLARASIEVPPSTCLFCGISLASGRAKEHIFPQWLLREFNEGRNQVEGKWTRTSTGEAVGPTRRVNLANFVNGKICAQCNNGWMSDLEGAAREPLLALAKRSRFPRSLSPEERGTLARWAVKTAAVLNHASNYDRLVPLEHCRAVMAGSAPHDVVVVVRQTRASFPLRWWETQDTIWWGERGNMRERKRVKAAIRASYRLALSVGHLFLLVSYWPDARAQYVLQPGIHLPVWPLRGEWPVKSQNPVDTDRAGLGLEHNEGRYAGEMMTQMIAMVDEDAQARPTYVFWRDV